MTHDVPSSCPVCAGELVVTQLHCRSCCTALESRFAADRAEWRGRDRLALAGGTLDTRAGLRGSLGAPRRMGNPWRTM